MMRVPFDGLARDANVLWWVITKLSQEASAANSFVPPQYLAKAAADLVDTVSWQLATLRESTIASIFGEALLAAVERVNLGSSSLDIRPMLTGENGYSGPIKLIVALLALRQWSHVRGQATLCSHVLRAGFELAMYMAAKRYVGGVLARDPEGSAQADNVRTSVLCMLLGVDFESKRWEVLDDDLRESREQRIARHAGECPFDVNTALEGMKALRETNLMESVDGFVAVARVAPLVVEAAAEPAGTVCAQLPIPLPALGPRSVEQTFGLVEGVSAELFMLASTTLALKQKAETDRIDREAGVSRSPDFGTLSRASITEWLNGVYLDLYAEEHEHRVASERAERERQRIARLVAHLVETTDVHVFLTELQQGIPNRSAPGYTELEQKMLAAREGEASEVAVSKLWVLFTGRQAHAPSEPVWAHGSARIGMNKAFRARFDALDSTGQQWEAVAAVARQNRRHVYREGRNRHGHGNDFPSYFALGYLSLEEMQQSVSGEEFAAYRSAHSKCCFPHSVHADNTL
jgi:hypothetical protein